MMDFDKTLIIQFANFLILMILLNFLLFKPVLRALDKRQKTIGSLFENAEGVKQKTAALEKTYEEETKERKKPILELHASSVSEAHRVSTGIIEKARQDLSEELARLKAEIGGETKRVRDALMADVEKLGTEAAEKILKRSL